MPLGVAWWRAILAPWNPQIKAARPRSHADFFGSDRRFPPMTPVAWREFVLRCREAMELLRALVAVEQVSWADMFDTLLSTRKSWTPSRPRHLRDATIWFGTSQQHRDYLTISSFGHELIGPQANHNKNTDIVELATIYFGADESTMRPQFCTAMQTIYAALSPEERQRLDQQETIPIQFTFTMRSAPAAIPGAAFLRSIGDFARLVASRSAVERPHGGGDRWQYRFPFKLTKLTVMDVNEFAASQRGISAALTELLSLGVQLYETLDLGRSSWFMSCPISELGPILRSLTDELSFRSLGAEEILPSTSVSSLRLNAYGFGKPGVDERTRLRQLGAVFSALAVSRDTRELVLGLLSSGESPESGERFLKWLTYALFSKDSTSSITSLGIDTYEFTSDDAVGITRVLEARNPSRALLDTSMITVIQKTTDPSARRDPFNLHQPFGLTPDTFIHGSEYMLTSGFAQQHLPGYAGAGLTPRPNNDRVGGRATRTTAAATAIAPALATPEAPAYIEIIDDEDEEDRDLGFAVVKAGTTIKVKPLDTPNEQATDSFVLQQDGRFRVMRNADGSDWVDVVVPCYGHCVVARTAVAHIDLSIAPESSFSAGYSGAITSLKLGHFDCRALLPLIEFVGPKLERLTIEGEMANEDVRRVLYACPNLFELTLGCTSEPTDEVFIEAYESGRCKVEFLSIDGFFWTDYYDEPSTDFIWELQNPASAAAKTLRGLDLLEARVSEEFVDACISMLASNRTLEYLRFYVVDYILEAREPALMMTNGMRLPSRPLSLKQKHAFLGVLSHLDSLSASSSSTTTAKPPRKRPRQTNTSRGVDYGQLDRLVLSLIFSFAATRGGTRRLYIDSYDGEITPPER